MHSNANEYHLRLSALFFCPYQDRQVNYTNDFIYIEIDFNKVKIEIYNSCNLFTEIQLFIHFTNIIIAGENVRNK